MLFFNKCDVKQGEWLPSAWIAWGKHYIRGGYFKFNLPLFILMWGMRPEALTERFGWYVPSIRIMWGYHDFIITWYYEFHSDFMGERQEISHRKGVY